MTKKEDDIAIDLAATNEFMKNHAAMRKPIEDTPAEHKKKKDAAKAAKQPVVQKPNP